MHPSPYDPDTLLERAKQWRAEAAVATLEEVRLFCLTEADRCERRVHRSQSTPVFREAADDQETQACGPLQRLDPETDSRDR
jgi:hypothetical protein